MGTECELRRTSTLKQLQGWRSCVESEEKLRRAESTPPSSQFGERDDLRQLRDGLELYGAGRLDIAKVVVKVLLGDSHLFSELRPQLISRTFVNPSYNGDGFDAADWALRVEPNASP